MKKVLICTISICLFAGFSCKASEKTEKPTIQDSNFLSLVLTQSFQDGGYTVVKPQTELFTFEPNDVNGTKERKDYVKKSLKIEGYDVTKLLDNLVERNKKSVRLTLKSAPEKGYIIDYDGTYSKYFEKDGGGWSKWRSDHPNAHGQTGVSLPAYDPKAGIVLVYKGTLSGPLAGSGSIIAYKYEKGKLTEIARAMLWVS